MRLRVSATAWRLGREFLWMRGVPSVLFPDITIVLYSAGRQAPMNVVEDCARELHGDNCISNFEFRFEYLENAARNPATPSLTAGGTRP